MVAASVIGGAGLSSSAFAATTITIDGAASCAHHGLVGVWVQSSGGGSKFAAWIATPGTSGDGVFYATISTTLPTTVQLHVGCGGSTANWWSDNWTAGKSESGSAVLEAACNEGTTKPKAGGNSRCAFGQTSSEAKAIKWAQSISTTNDYAGKCLEFTFLAYKAAGDDLNTWVPTTPSTYPQAIWGRFPHGEVGTGTPPAGALVFFNQTGSHDGHSQQSGYYSHVELSVGGGEMISTADTVNENRIHYETLAQHKDSGAWNIYVDWWLPA
jgi:hypothetical protein